LRPEFLLDVFLLPEDVVFFLPEVDAILSPHNILIIKNQYIIA